jgi:hypothetical protein
MFVRFDPDGSLDESFGRAGVAELDWDTPSVYFGGWARLADGRIASVGSSNGVWWFESFAVDGSAPGGLASAGSARLGLDVIVSLSDLAPTRDGGLLMIGNTRVRRVRPNSSLDRTFGRRCSQPALRGAGSRGGAATPNGGALVTAANAFDSFVVPRDAAGCVAAAPLPLRGLNAGPPLLQRRRRAIVGASYDKGLALIRIRR